MEFSSHCIYREGEFLRKESPLWWCLEALLYNSMDFPNILSPVRIVFEAKEIKIYMKPGISAEKVRPVLGSMIPELLQALIYLEDNNITHGDVKHENMIILDGKLKVIDFGLVVRRGVSRVPLTQSVGDAQHLKFQYGTEEDVVYDPYKDMIWALGMTVFSSLYDPSTVKWEKYSDLVPILEGKSSIELQEFGVSSKWSRFLELCFRPSESRHHSLRALVEEIDLVPLPDQHPRFKVTQTPPRTQEWSPLLDEVTFWICETCENQSLLPQSMIFAIELVWRYLYPCVLKGEEVTAQLLKEKRLQIEKFCCAAIALSGDLFLEDPELNKMAFDSNGAYTTSQLIQEFYSLLEILEFRLPSLFLDLEFDSDTEKMLLVYRFSRPSTLEEMKTLFNGVTLEAPLQLPARVFELTSESTLKRLHLV